MRLLLIFVTFILSGCVSHDVFLHEVDPDSAKHAIVGVPGIDAKLEKVNGKAFENFGNGGLVHRVHLSPGTYKFGVIALSDFKLGHESISHTRHEAEVTAEVLAGHVYGIRSDLTPEGSRRFQVVDLGTEVDLSCFRPRLQGVAYVSQTCKWP